MTSVANNRISDKPAPVPHPGAQGHAATPRLHPAQRLSDLVLSESAPYPPLERLLLLTIGKYFNKRGRCWPSIRTIARRCGLSPASVQRHLAAHRRSPRQIVAMTRRERADGKPGAFEFEFVGNIERFVSARDRRRTEGRITAAELMTLWNVAANRSDGGLLACKHLTAARSTRADREIDAHPSRDYWQHVCDAAAASTFCCGRESRPTDDDSSSPTHFDFDRLLRFHVQIDEGKYDDC
jgi:hypothetical protein